LLRQVFLKLVVLLEMARHDFRARFLGSYLGILWAFIHPIITIAVLLIIFGLGFKSAPVGEVPFALWLTVGMIPWLYFSETMNDATGSIFSSAFLVRKTSFNLSFLPVVKMLSNAIIHAALLCMVFILLIKYKFYPVVLWISILYYFFAMFCLILGLCWMTSAMAVFTRDVNNIVAVSMQIGFWVTPIFWDIHTMPNKITSYIKLNPVYYIINGYRDVFLYGIPFWRRPMLTVYFWSFTLLVLFCGHVVYKRLRPHFADVL
jgi:lipopolysaccharide transport system permease protein